MARYVDPTNLMEFFEAPVRPEPEVTDSSNQISKVFHGRLRASAYFFRVKEARSNKKLWESLKTLSDSYRNYLSQKLMIDVLRKELEQAESRTERLGLSLDDMISKVSFTYTSLESPQIRPEMIIGGGDGVSKDVRDAISLNCRM